MLPLLRRAKLAHVETLNQDFDSAMLLDRDRFQERPFARMISWLFLALATIGGWFTFNAYVPLRRPPVLSTMSFFAGWLTTELVVHVYAEIPGAQHAFEVFPSLRTTFVIHGVERFLTVIYGQYLEGRDAATLPAEGE